MSQNTLANSVNTDLNHKLRVMSTPEWPVPYWQRIHRHDPAPNMEDTWKINKPIVSISDEHVILAKEMLKSVGKGYVVEAVENHFDITDYRTSFKDSSRFTEAYVDDLLDCVDIATKQNVKLLNHHDLGDCLR